MDVWSILKISPTNDQARIKRAYITQLKFYHPEEDAAGFQCLYGAYTNALKQAQCVLRTTAKPTATSTKTIDPPKTPTALINSQLINNLPPQTNEHAAYC